MRETKPNFPGVVLGLIMHVSRYWIFWIFVFNICLFIYKGICLPYAGSYYPLDLCLYISWGLIGLIRHSVGKRGVARMSPVGLAWFCALSAFALIASSYFAFLQTYGLRIEFLFNTFCLAIEALETLLSLISAIMYVKKDAL